MFYILNKLVHVYSVIKCYSLVLIYSTWISAGLETSHDLLPKKVPSRSLQVSRIPCCVLIDCALIDCAIVYTIFKGQIQVTVWRMII